MVESDRLESGYSVNSGIAGSNPAPSSKFKDPAMKSRPIGIYDSGIGGLTVLKEFIKLFPHEDFIYFADTLNFPYGNKSKTQIVDYTRAIISWLQNEMDAKFVIAACHTISALALDELKNEFHVPIIGTIYPLLKNLLNNDTHKKVGIIATPASALSRTHENIFIKHGFTGQILSVGCADFAPLIEAGQLEIEELKISATIYLKQFDDFKPDTLLYGCTHYPFIKSIIEKILPTTMQYLDPAAPMALEAFEILQDHKLLNTTQNKGTIQFYCSHAPERFETKIKKFIEFSHQHVICKNIHTKDCFLKT